MFFFDCRRTTRYQWGTFLMSPLNTIRFSPVPWMGPYKMPDLRLDFTMAYDFDNWADYIMSLASFHNFPIKQAEAAPSFLRPRILWSVSFLRPISRHWMQQYRPRRVTVDRVSCRVWQKSETRMNACMGLDRRHTSCQTVQSNDSHSRSTEVTHPVV